jgi:hypothetical protein
VEEEEDGETEAWLRQILGASRRSVILVRSCIYFDFRLGTKLKVLLC